MEDGADRARRRLLAEADDLLDRVEHLRLMERREVPPALADALRALQWRGGRAGGPRTVSAAQQLVYSVQQRLMGANPRNPQPRRHLDRAAGSPMMTTLPASGAAWKFLTLPAPGSARSDEEWREVVELTVERAFDRWSFVHGRVLAAAREHRPGFERELDRARAAWANYWELRREAEHLLAAPTTSRRAEGAGADGLHERSVNAS
jgi:hypothetical protein